jgi:hypothetical protein
MVQGRRTVTGLAIVAAFAYPTVVAPVEAADARVPMRAATVPLSPCTPRDNGYPQISSVTITPRRLDVTKRAGSFTITARASDDGGPGRARGVKSLRVAVKGLSDSTLVRRRPGVWTATVRVERHHKPGRYAADFANVEDGLHTIAYFGSEIPSVHGRAAITIVSPKDTAAPQITDLRLGSASVDATTTEQNVPITAHVTDDGSGADLVVLYFSVGAAGVGQLELRRATGRAWDGTWTGTLKIPSPAPSSSPSGVWTIEVFVGDRAHHFHTVTAAELAAQGLTSSLTVQTTSAVPQPPPPQPSPAPPVIRDVRQSTSAVDVRRHDARIVVTARVTDAGSDVTEVGFTDDRGEIDVLMRLVSGDKHDGVWQGTIVVPRCASVSGPFTRQLAAVNGRREGSATAEDAVRYRVRAADVMAPKIVDVQPYLMPVTGPVRVFFDQDVTGISPRSAQVLRGGDDPRYSVTRRPAVPGTWRCQAATGVRVNCLHGSARTATWTPRKPLRSLTYYSIAVNPEHVITVTDLHGNAIFGGISFMTGMAG